MLLEASLDACDACCIMEDEKKHQKSVLDETTAFIRAHDLELTDADIAKCIEEAENGDDEQRTDVTSINKKELLSVNSCGSGAIMNALVTVGLHEATDESSRWIAISATDRILKKRAKLLKKGLPLDGDGDGPIIMGPWTNAAIGKEVFVWYSKCTRPGHGSEYPVVRSRGLIPASAADVVELIRDSDRVTDYNKMALGREDQAMLTLQVEGGGGSDLHCSETKCPELGVPGEAKIMSSKSQPPLVRKPLEFKTLFYARRVNDGEEGVETDGVAYITVGRSVWESPDGTAEGSDGSTIRCELMLSVNLVREIKTENGEMWCELTSITHGVSPGVPIFVGKQLGLVAAENYIKDIRTLFEK